MSLWTEIVNTALIGCERKPLSLNRQEGQLGVLLAQFDQNDREGALLGAAALVSLYDRAGSSPLKGAQPLPQACEPDGAPRCSERAASHLAMMLRGEYKELFPEWMAKTAAAGRRAPEEMAPSLLEFSLSHRGLIEDILPVLGARGRWLAAQNSSWFYAVGVFDETLWETGSNGQRWAVLTELRKKDAARGRELLASSWSQESQENRNTFLGALEKGLSLDDEDFLDAALDDRDEKVRRLAATWLARIPGSALLQRMLDRMRPLLRFTLDRRKRKTIEVTLPEACDQAMRRDGVIEAKPRLQPLGQKAWWLLQMLNTIPPNVWSQESGWTISELIEAASRSEEKQLLLKGWLRATELYRDVEWAAALLAETFETEETRFFEMFNILPDARQEAFIIEQLRKSTSFQTGQPVRKIVGFCFRPWSVNLSRLMSDALLRHAATDGVEEDWRWEGFLNNIGCRLDPSLIPEAVTRLTEATKSGKPQPPLEKFLDFIQFRHEMLKEIDQ